MKLVIRQFAGSFVQTFNGQTRELHTVRLYGAGDNQIAVGESTNKMEAITVALKQLIEQAKHLKRPLYGFDLGTLYSSKDNNKPEYTIHVRIAGKIYKGVDASEDLAMLKALIQYCNATIYDFTIGFVESEAVD